MANNESSTSGKLTTMIYACSGASDVGEIADRAARHITRLGIGKMSCIAGIAVDKPNLIASASTANRRLVVDGCPLDCGRKIMENAGMTFDYVRVTDLGMKKGDSPATEERIASVADACIATLVAKGQIDQ
jgi:uncharacterized metal-binding protein